MVCSGFDPAKERGKEDKIIASKSAFLFLTLREGESLSLHLVGSGSERSQDIEGAEFFLCN